MTNQEMIKSMRVKADLTQEVCAKLLCVNTRTYQRWEQGTRFCPPGMVKLLHLLIGDADKNISTEKKVWKKDESRCS
jgi:DNA-binding transcriptional regulator YiaG